MPTENRDIDLRVVGWTAAAIIAMTGAVLLASGGLFAFWHRPQGVPRAASAYDGPLLQAVPEADLAQMRQRDAREDARIRRAMDALARSGIPPISPGLTMQDMQKQR